MSKQVSHRFPVAMIALGLFASTAEAQTASSLTPGWWQPAAIEHARRMQMFVDPLVGGQATPAVIDGTVSAQDATGVIASYQPNGKTFTSSNAFFQNIGTNGRTCFTCHQPETGWTVTPAAIQSRYAASRGTDPVFRLVDGATCPNADISTNAKRITAFSLLLNKGLIRVGLPAPVAAQSTTYVSAITVQNDPYGCSNNNASNTVGIYSFYRRPLPTTNLAIQNNVTPPSPATTPVADAINQIMWDGREPSLITQSNSAVLIHSQSSRSPTPTESGQMIQFETGIYTAQLTDSSAGKLNAAGATGGPVTLSTQPFVAASIKASLGPPPVSSNAFDLYTAWNGLSGTDRTSAARESIVRGEALFNSPTVKSCSGCHNAVDNGNHNGAGTAATPEASFIKFFNTGLGLAPSAPVCTAGTGTSTDQGQSGCSGPTHIGLTAAALADLNLSGLPVFTVTCTDPNNGNATTTYQMTDLGRAMNTGLCADLGSFKAPSLRGLASRAPYFHNGAAPTLRSVVNFYNDNFHIGFTPQNITDLVNFLQTL